jgi:lipoprotein-releasing system permease protein
MLELALRHLTSRKKQTFLIFLGIALGTMTYVFIAGMQLGFREFIVAQLVNNNGHIVVSAREEVITPESMREELEGTEEEQKRPRLLKWVVEPSGKRNDDRIENAQGWLNRFEKEPEVFAASAMYSTQVIIRRSSTKLAANLVGVHPDNHIKVTDYANSSSPGAWNQLQQGARRLIVGTGALKKLGAVLGDTLLISVGENVAQPFKVTGSFELGVQQVDDSTFFAHVVDVQQLAHASGRISTISVRLLDATLATALADRLGTLSVDKVQSWEQINANFFSLFKMQDLFRYFITGGILLIAAFGIYNVLSIVVTQKRREIAILRALGFPPRDILSLFLQQGLILGLSGAVAGLILGYLFCYTLAHIDFQIMGRRALTISFSSEIYVQGFVMALISSLLASYLPARMASRLSPIDIIRMDS